MRVERAVIVADTGVIAPDHQVRTPEILAEQRVQQRLARPGIAHLDGIARLDHRAGPEIALGQRVDRRDPDFGRDVARL